MKAPRMPRERPKRKTENRTMKGENGEGPCGYARLDIAAHDELDEIEAGEHG